ncbi:nitroreductase family deazaflavin-dependent oxidoreductase [Streptomyces sp. NPDC007983]|uniref:nitroreductase family deazaflavin-dependent oxidoreductase n=1 Tax=Streptomyces sp. NPDC007983 TaxID=3364800 RepID=UPI0036EB8808
MAEHHTDAAISAIGRSHLRDDPEALKAFNENVVEEFRANGGKVGGPFEGADIVLLTMTGAKSGRPRLTPTEYFTVDGRLFIVGSYGGLPRNPAWVHNLRADARAHVEIGTDTYDVIAREVPPDERDALFTQLVELAPRLAGYQAKTVRKLPLFELHSA